MLLTILVMICVIVFLGFKLLDYKGSLLATTSKLKDEQEALVRADKQIRSITRIGEEHLTTIRKLKDSDTHDIRQYKRRITELEDKLSKRSQLESLKFTAMIPLTGLKQTTFSLGLGSCGKHVIALAFEETHDWYIITQWCDDDTKKTFEYRKEDISGRIEKGYRPFQKREVTQ